MPRNFRKPEWGAITAALFIAILIFSSGFLAACKGEPPPPPKPSPVVTPTPQPAPTPTPIEPVEPATRETGTGVPGPDTPQAAAFIYRIYEDEENPEQFVDLIEFTTGCEGLGDIFANDELVINPTRKNRRKVPFSRVVSLTFNKVGHFEIQIHGAGKMYQPADYHENTIVLKDPDETLEGILVICRELKGRKTDGTEWTIDLRHKTARNFHKIEIIQAPQE